MHITQPHILVIYLYTDMKKKKHTKKALGKKQSKDSIARKKNRIKEEEA